MTIDTFFTILTGTYFLQTSARYRPDYGAQDVPSLRAGRVTASAGSISGEQTYTTHHGRPQTRSPEPLLCRSVGVHVTLNTANANHRPSGSNIPISIRLAAVLSAFKRQNTKNDPLNGSLPGGGDNEQLPEPMERII